MKTTFPMLLIAAFFLSLSGCNQERTAQGAPAITGTIPQTPAAAEATGPAVGAARPSELTDPDQVARLAPAVVRQKVQSGEALLVCAYDNEAVCQRSHLEGSITLAELRRRLPGLDRNQELIFYCG